MPRRNIFLSDHQNELVAMLIRSGRYRNASEVLREGLRLIEERQSIEAGKLNALNQAVRKVGHMLLPRGPQTLHGIGVRTSSAVESSGKGLGL